MYRVGIVLKDGTIPEGKNFKTREECDEWILQQAEKLEIKRAIIAEKKDISNREIINF